MKTRYGSGSIGLLRKKGGPEKGLAASRQTLRVGDMATLKDVAREAGLSVGTVSRVLNNRGYISEETRQNVERAMAKLHYQPNEMARSLSKQTTHTIGLIVPSIDHPYFSKFISCLERAASAQDYRILLFCSRGEADRESEYVDACRSNRVAGLILCSGGVHTRSFQNLGFPLVTYERFLDSGDACVACDNFEGGELAGEVLLGRGCRNIAYLGGIGETAMPADERLGGLKTVCAAAGADVQELNFEAERIHDRKYRVQIVRFLQEHPDIDGMFCNSDVIGAQAIQACRQLGIEIPARMKIVGYDDVDISEFTVPELTTIHQPVREMANECISIIRKYSAGESVLSRTIFHVSLVTRQSA